LTGLCAAYFWKTSPITPILDLLNTLAKGYSMMEIIREASGKGCPHRALRWVHPKKITFRETLTPKILTEEEPVRGIEPPPCKFVHHRCRARSGYDTRAGIMQVRAWLYHFKNYAIRDWMGFAEVYGMPLRICKHEPGASKADREALIRTETSTVNCEGFE
jgi:phage gp29-like protein